MLLSFQVIGFRELVELTYIQNITRMYLCDLLKIISRGLDYA